MSYDPKIYIRGYGSPDASIIVRSTPIDVDFHPGRVIRNLLVDVVQPLGLVDGLLLSGDAQTDGDDVLLLSGTTGKLWLSNSSLVRVTLHDAEILTGTFIDADGIMVEVDLHPAAFERNLLVTGETLTTDVTLHPAGIVRNLQVDAAPFDLTVTLHDVEIIVVRHLLLSGDAQITGSDRLLLSGDAQVSGTDTLIISE